MARAADSSSKRAHRSGDSMTPSSETRVDSISLRIAPPPSQAQLRAGPIGRAPDRVVGLGRPASSAGSGFLWACPAHRGLAEAARPEAPRRLCVVKGGDRGDPLAV